ncbi:MAG TPA: hypothetical protein VGG39_35020 [Polyangiaceae bacterium]|jgi:hypothetical protein
MKRALPSLALVLVVTLASPAALADPSSIAPAAAAPAPPPAVPSPPSPTRTSVALASAGVAVAAAGTAAVFGVLALQNKSDFQSSATYGRAQDGNNDAAYADGAIALAVAAGVTSLVLFLTRDAVSSAPPAALSAVPLVTAHGGGAGAVLRF